MKNEKTTAAYEYNAQGYRVEKTVNGDTTNYLYNADKVVLETDATGNQTAFQAYGSALLYRSVTGTQETSAGSYYYLYNAHGDVTSLIDNVGSVAATYDYDAFGNVIDKTGNVDNHITYAGYQSDDESGLYYLNARYYDSETARFITEDSYEGEKNKPLTLNLYTYCSNNPIMYTDPSGHAGTSVHYNDTYTIAKEKFEDYIDTQYDKIDIYKRDKNGKIITKNGKKQKDSNKVMARDAWRDLQYAKADDYAKALATGDKYVDDETTILHNSKDTKTEGDYDYKYFHAFNVKGNTKRKDTVTSLVEYSQLATEYLMTGKGKKPSLSFVLGHASYTITTSKISKTEGTRSKISTTSVSLPLDGYTNVEKALFVSGMGLHTLQDSYYHVTEDHNKLRSDDNSYDYVNGKWTDDNKHKFKIDGVNKTFTGGDRYEQTLNATSDWVDDLVTNYGDEMFAYTPPKKSK